MGVDSSLRELGFEAMIGGYFNTVLHNDTLDLEIFKQTATILGCQLANTAAYLDPEPFVFMGGLSKAGDSLLKPTIESMEKILFNAFKGKT